jgi:hypothetical protein
VACATWARISQSRETSAVRRWLATYDNISVTIAGPYQEPSDGASPLGDSYQAGMAVLVDANTGAFLEAESY